MNFSEKIDRIESKVELLAVKLKALQEENTTLQTENRQLKADLEQEQTQKNELINQLEKTQRALERKRNNDPESVQQLRQQIDKYVVEIDKCLEWLHKV